MKILRPDKFDFDTVMKCLNSHHDFGGKYIPHCPSYRAHGYDARLYDAMRAAGYTHAKRMGTHQVTDVVGPSNTPESVSIFLCSPETPSFAYCDDLEARRWSLALLAVDVVACPAPAPGSVQPAAVFEVLQTCAAVKVNYTHLGVESADTAVDYIEHWGRLYVAPASNGKLYVNGLHRYDARVAERAKAFWPTLVGTSHLHFAMRLYGPCIGSPERDVGYASHNIELFRELTEDTEAGR